MLLKLNEESQVWWGAIYRLFDLQTDGWIRIPLDNDPIRIVIPHVDSRKPTKEPYEVCERLKLICVRRPDNQTDSTLVYFGINKTILRAEIKKALNGLSFAGFSEPMEANIRFMDCECPSTAAFDDPKSNQLPLCIETAKFMGLAMDVR